MAAPIIQQIVLDLRQAEAQLDALERQVAQLDQTITVPVQVDDSQFERLQSELAGADETVNIDVNAPGAQQAAEVFGEVSGEIAEVRTEAQQTQQRIDDLGDELDRTGSRGVSAFGNLRSTLLGLGAALGVGIGLREVVTQLRDAVLAASDLEQSIGGVQAIFGTSADEVLRFGEA